MRFFAKSVAVALSLLLWAPFVFAEFPCAESNCAKTHNTSCCQEMGMDASAMSASTAMALTLTQAKSPVSLCNCIAISEVLAPMMLQEAQKLAVPAASTVDLVLLQPGLAKFAPESYRTPPLSPFSCSSQSILCTFQI